MANLRSNPASAIQTQEATKPPKEYDYLDYEENEKKLEELRSKELNRFKNMFGEQDNNNAMNSAGDQNGYT